MSLLLSISIVAWVAIPLCERSSTVVSWRPRSEIFQQKTAATLSQKQLRFLWLHRHFAILEERKKRETKCVCVCVSVCVVCVRVCVREKERESEQAGAAFDGSCS